MRENWQGEGLDSVPISFCFILVCVMSCDSHVNLDDSLSQAHYILDIAAILVITGLLTGWGHFPGTPGSPGVSSS